MRCAALLLLAACVPKPTPLHRPLQPLPELERFDAPDEPGDCERRRKVGPGDVVDCVGYVLPPGELRVAEHLVEDREVLESALL